MLAYSLMIAQFDYLDIVWAGKMKLKELDILTIFKGGRITILICLCYYLCSCLCGYPLETILYILTSEYKCVVKYDIKHDMLKSSVY